MPDEGISAGVVHADVVPDLSRFAERMRRQAVPAAAEVGREIAARLAEPIAGQVASAMRDGVRDGGRLATAQATKVGASIGRTLGREITRHVAEAVKTLPAARIDADTTPAERKIAALEARLARAGKNLKVDITANVKVSDTTARAALARVQAAVDRLDGRTITITVNADITRGLVALQAVAEAARFLNGQKATVTVAADTGGARANLAAVAAQARAVARLRPTITVTANTGGAAARLAGIGLAASGAGGGISGMLAIAALIAPLIAPAAAAAAGALAAIATGALVGVAGIGVLILALAPVISAVKAMSAAQDEAGKSAGTLAGQQASLAAASDQVRSAEASLANTRTTVAESNRRAAQQVTAAQRDLTSAEADALRVRRELSQAYEDARRALEDLNASVGENATAQRQANLDVAAAKAERDKVFADKTATAAQREQADINYQREVEQLEDLERRGKRLHQDQAAANRAGVEGSDQVRAARDRIAQADEKVSAQQRAVSEARRAQQEQERQGDFQIAQARQAVAAAQRSLQAATVRTGDTGSAAMDKLHRSMAALSPEGQRFARFLFGLGGLLRGLQRTAEAGLLPGLQRGMEALLPFFPQLKALVGEMARAIGDGFEIFLTSLTSPEWRAFFGYLSEIAGPTLRGMALFAADVGRGFAAIVVAFAPVTKQIGGGLLGLAAGFAKWAASLKDNPQFQQFIGYVLSNGPNLMRLLGDVLVVAFKLVVAFAPLGQLMLDALGPLFDWLSKMNPGVLMGIAAGIAGIGVAIAIAFDATPIGLIITAIVLLVAAIVYAWQHSETFRTVVITALQGIAAAAMWMWNTVLKPTFEALRHFFVDVIAPAAVWLWQNVLKPAFEGIAAVVAWAWNNIIRPALSGFWFFITNFVIPVVLLFWHGIIEPAFTGIQIAIKVAWAIIQIVFGLMMIYIRYVLAPIFLWFWRNIVKPVFEGLGRDITFVWNKVIKPILSTLGDFIKTYVAPAFQKGVDAIGKAWDRVRDVAKTPIKFVLQYVIGDKPDRGIIGAYNWLAGKVGADTIAPVKLPAGFARGGILPNPAALAAGGVLPGYTPGRDVHRFFSATGGMLDLSGGEAVMRPEFTAALGSSAINAANFAARRNGIAGVREWLLRLLSQVGGDVSSPLSGYILPNGAVGRGGTQFADGGYLGGFDKGGVLGSIVGAVKSAWDTFTDPVGAIKSEVGKLIAKIPGAGHFRDVAVSVSNRLLGDAVKWATDKVGAFFGLGGGPTTGKVADVQHWIKGQEGKPYIWASSGPNGFDCSGLVGAVYRLMQGRSPNTRIFSTHNEGAFFVPGAGMNMAGWAHAGERGGGSVGHTAGRLAGLRYEATPPRVRVGNAATDVTRFAHVGHQPGLALGGIITLPTRQYDSGGYLPTGLSLARNDTGAPEPVLTGQQWTDMRATTSDSRRRPVVEIENYYERGNDPHAVAADLDWLSRARGG